MTKQNSAAVSPQLAAAEHISLSEMKTTEIINQTEHSIASKLPASKLVLTSTVIFTVNNI